MFFRQAVCNPAAEPLRMNLSYLVTVLQGTNDKAPAGRNPQSRRSIYYQRQVKGYQKVRGHRKLVEIDGALV